VLGLRMGPTVLVRQPLRLHDLDKEKFSSFAFTVSH
jgi:hypothetical protein